MAPAWHKVSRWSLSQGLMTNRFIDCRSCRNRHSNSRSSLLLGSARSHYGCCCVSACVTARLMWLFGNIFCEEAGSSSSDLVEFAKLGTTTLLKCSQLQVLLRKLSGRECLPIHNVICIQSCKKTAKRWTRNRSDFKEGLARGWRVQIDCLLQLSHQKQNNFLAKAEFSSYWGDLVFGLNTWLEITDTGPINHLLARIHCVGFQFA